MSIAHWMFYFRKSMMLALIALKFFFIMATKVSRNFFSFLYVGVYIR
jgi:hypothetical protein